MNSIGKFAAINNVKIDQSMPKNQRWRIDVTVDKNASNNAVNDSLTANSAVDTVYLSAQAV
ncbi:MAG: hypothetical protein HRU25_17730 [Psychrobium sp.]|nr:hypothetical protein [Psychrobium sp.]